MQKSEHISGEDLLLLLDGELRERCKSALTQHLEACWECRARLMNLQNSIADFVNVHHRRFESALPHGDGPRALLRARLREMEECAPVRKWPLVQAGRWMAILAGVAALVAVFILSFRAAAPPSGVLDKPIPALTPGKSIAVSLTQVCSPEFKGSNNVTDLPYALKKRVFDRYGMPRAHFRNYEVDFLITPSLGGAVNVENLWPEPYRDTPWNAHVKDQLEVRLHTMVCSHQITLSAAQQDISSDWIRSYRRIFRTNRPLAHPQPAALLFTLLKFPEHE